ncbi:hypothetical protein AVEN_50548-1 [Araneus ventricosus]|uniref:Tc1-like transposase DDE domain-containing protein n=1 Tax=Araneus ventricosus TaxID=182803 RepID=A0A4Y2ASL5_ARAVE|nr:hypothetical protein AVEN_50548-1 [Araneus ventricosus]
MMGYLQVSACELFSGPSLIWALRAEGPSCTVVDCTKLYSSPRPENTTIGLLMTGNTLPGLTSLVSNCIGRMHVYEYGDSIINQQTLFVNRGLFNLCDGLGQFQQENATPHTSRVATKWLQENSPDFRHFYWPPKSPEMNIIEDIRAALLHAVEKISPPPRTSMDLLTALQGSWCQFLPGYLQTLVESMPRCFASLLRAPGGPTRY